MDSYTSLIEKDYSTVVVGLLFLCGNHLAISLYESSFSLWCLEEAKSYYVTTEVLSGFSPWRLRASWLQPSEEFELTASSH